MKVLLWGMLTFPWQRNQFTSWGSSTVHCMVSCNLWHDVYVVIFAGLCGYQYQYFCTCSTYDDKAVRYSICGNKQLLISCSEYTCIPFLMLHSNHQVRNTNLRVYGSSVWYWPRVNAHMLESGFKVNYKIIIRPICNQYYSSGWKFFIKFVTVSSKL